MEQQCTTDIGGIECSPHRWRIWVVGLLWVALNSVISAFRESVSIKPILVQIALILTFAIGSWFVTILIWVRFATKPVLGLVLWLLPLFILAGINLRLMSTTLAEAPIALYLAAPLVRVSQPKKGEYLPRTLIEWGVILLLFGLMLAALVLPWGDIAGWIIASRRI